MTHELTNSMHMKIGLLSLLTVMSVGVLAWKRLDANKKVIPGRLAAAGKTLPIYLFPKLRDSPRRFLRNNKVRVVVSDKAVAYAKSLCAPTFRNPPVSMLIHELRLFGTDSSFSEFENARCANSTEILLA